MLRKESRRKLDRRSQVYRVRFHYSGEKTKVLPSLSIEEVKVRLGRMDRRRESGAWTTRVLRLIEKNPRVAASRLAERSGSEQLRFKADVRKLVKLGLVRSHEVGYELTKRGRVLLRDQSSDVPYK